MSMSYDVTEGVGRGVVGDYGGFKIGFHMVGSCRPLSRFMLPTLSRMWIASAVLLFQYPLTLLFTLAPSQLRAF